MLVTSSNLSEYECTNRDDGGPARTGDEVRGVTRVAGRDLEWTARVTAAEPGRSVTFESIEAVIPYTLHVGYEDLGNDRTRYTFRQVTDEFGGAFGKLADAVVTRMYAKNVQSNLAALKEYAESR